MVASTFNFLNAVRRDGRGNYKTTWKPFDPVRHAAKKAKNRSRKRSAKDGDDVGSCVCVAIGVCAITAFYAWVAMHERV